MPFGGKASKLSRDLSNVRTQLKSGVTRGKYPKPLLPEETTALEQKRDALMAEMKATAKERW